MKRDKQIGENLEMQISISLLWGEKKIENQKRQTLIIREMSPNIVELDNNDQLLIYSQELKQYKKSHNTKSQSHQLSNTKVHSQLKRQSFISNQKNSDINNKGLPNLPAKFVLRPLLLKHIDRIINLYLEQKTPHEIQDIIKQTTLVQIQCILKQKIHTFLNIIFESSHCYQQQQVQKIRPEIDRKIQRISLQLLDPLKNNFLDSIRYQNFLKLMKYHKQGRRSQKISKKCNTFFRLFFLKMKFEGISHTEGNTINLNESKNKSKDSFMDEEESSDQSDYRQKKKNKSSKKGSQSSNKKYFYGKEQVVSQKIMDEATQKLLKQIREKILRPDSQKIHQKNLTQDALSKSSFKKETKLQTSSVSKPQIEIADNSQIFEWTFQKQNSLIFLLYQSLYQKSKPLRTVRLINESFSNKYQKIFQAGLSAQKIVQKIESMYSISCQKFMRRIKFLTIKQSLQNNQNLNEQQKVKQQGKENPSFKKSPRKLAYSMENMKIMEGQDGHKSLSKEDQFYFSKLKQRLKALQIRHVYFSSFEGSLFMEEWSFMLEFIREFYFSNLEDFKFDYLLGYAKKVIQLNIQNKKYYIDRPISLEDYDEEQIPQTKENNKNQRQKDILQNLPKSSFSFALSKMSKTKPSVNSEINESKAIQSGVKSQSVNQMKQLEFISIDEILNKSINQDSLAKKSAIEQNDLKFESQKFFSNEVKQQALNLIPPSLQRKKDLLESSQSNRSVKNATKVDRTVVINQQSDQKYVNNLNNPSWIGKETKRLGQPIKKIKQNEYIVEEKKIKKQQQEEMYKRKQNEINIESEEQFEEILELSGPFSQQSEGQLQILQKTIPEQSDKYSQQKRSSNNRNQNTLHASMNQKNDRKLIQENTRLKFFRQIVEQEGELTKEQLALLQEQIQEETYHALKDQQEGDIAQNQVQDLSVIVEEQEEDLSKNHSNYHQPINNLLPLQDQYSIYQIDCPLKDVSFQNSSFIKSKILHITVDQTKAHSPLKSNKDTKKQQKKSFQTLQIIQRQLQKIKSMHKSQPQSALTSSFSDRSNKSSLNKKVIILGNLQNQRQPKI